MKSHNYCWSRHVKSFPRQCHIHSYFRQLCAKSKHFSLNTIHILPWYEGDVFLFLLFISWYSSMAIVICSLLVFRKENSSSMLSALRECMPIALSTASPRAFAFPLYVYRKRCVKTFIPSVSSKAFLISIVLPMRLRPYMSILPPFFHLEPFLTELALFPSDKHHEHSL